MVERNFFQILQTNGFMSRDIRPVTKVVFCADPFKSEPIAVFYVITASNFAALCKTTE